jgi:hypothetical protein
MTQAQIANLFGVFTSAIAANVRSILKSEVLREENISRRRTYRDGSFTMLYNLEMITALAFRLKSRQAGAFRRWIIGQAVSPPAILWEIPRTDGLPN